MIHKISGSLVLVMLLVLMPAAAQDQAVSVDSLYNQGGIEYGNGNFAEAARLMRIAAAGQEEISGQRSLRYAEIIDDLGYVLTDLQEYPEAKEWLNVALEIRTELSNPDSLDLGDTYENLSRLYARTGEFEKAIASFNSAEGYYARYYGKQNASYAYFVYLWASELYNAEQFIASAGPYGDAAENYLAAEGQGSINAMWCLRNEAYANLLGGSHQQSAQQYAALIELYQDIEDAQSQLPEWYSEMGNALALLTRIDDAVAATEESIRLSGLMLGTESPEFADAVYMIGKMFEGADLPAQARQYFVRSLPLLESAYGKATYDYVVGLSGVSLSYIEEENYPEALKIFNDLVPLTAAVLDSSSADFTAIAGNFTFAVESYAVLLFESERFEDFASLHEAARELEYVLNGESDYYAKFVYQQADGYARAGDTTKAVVHLNEFLEIEQRQYDAVTEDQAVGLQRLAMLYQGLKEYPLADSLYDESLSAFEVSVGRDSNSYLDAVATVASYYYSRALYDQALEYFELGVKVGLAVHGESSLQYVAQKFNVAAMYQRLGRTDEAIEMVSECIALEDRYRPDSSDNAIEWNHAIAKFFRDENQYEQAIPYYESALQRIEKSGLRYGEYWTIAHALSESYFALEEMEKMVDINRRLVAFTRDNEIKDTDLWSLV
ncbi:MAG: tetratricopeptide repeat protein, partial [Rhodothermales bacterium]|nr:tetratricopeptide repeat protein [Rhodothermales bacterium]